MKSKYKKCLVCKSKFKYFVSNPRKYCSIECYNKDKPNISKRVHKNGFCIKEKICKLCNKKFIPTSTRQLYCGVNKKTGCSYKINLVRQKKYHYDKKIKRYCEICKDEINDNGVRFCKKCRFKIKRCKKGVRKLRTRFLVFERDNFTCQYCGRKSPECVLQIDHIYPKSKGGVNDINNYKTSCDACNLGKGDYILKEFIDC